MAGEGETFRLWYGTQGVKRSRGIVAKKCVTQLGWTLAVLCLFADAAWGQNAPDFNGRWTLSPTLSQMPKEIGFSVDWATPFVPGSPESSGGGGRRRGGGGNRPGQPYLPHAESADEALRLRQLTDEVRQPPSHLTIVDTPAEVTITNPDRDQSRKFHPNGRDEVIQLDGTDVGINAKRDAGRLVVLYAIEQGRQIRYTYVRNTSPSQVIVGVEFVGRGGGDQVKLVYEPRKADEPDKPVAPTAPTAPAGTAPATGQQPQQQQQQPINQGPDAELRGLKKIGVVVEGLSQQAAGCGLKQDALESSVTKHLTDAGFTVPRNTDEDTYIYVNVMTASLSNGYCVSRYDASLNSHTTATLTYQSAPVLVEVSLLHKGGIAGGTPAVHADGVLKGLLDYIDGFVARSRDANKAH